MAKNVRSRHTQVHEIQVKCRGSQTEEKAVKIDRAEEKFNFKDSPTSPISFTLDSSTYMTNEAVRLCELIKVTLLSEM